MGSGLPGSLPSYLPCHLLLYISYLANKIVVLHSAVLRLHVVRPSVCDVGGSGSHRLESLETNCTDNSPKAH